MAEFNLEREIRRTPIEELRKIVRVPAPLEPAAITIESSVARGGQRLTPSAPAGRIEPPPTAVISPLEHYKAQNPEELAALEPDAQARGHLDSLVINAAATATQEGLEQATEQECRGLTPESVEAIFKETLRLRAISYLDQNQAYSFEHPISHSRTSLNPAGFNSIAQVLESVYQKKLEDQQNKPPARLIATETPPPPDIPRKRSSFEANEADLSDDELKEGEELLRELERVDERTADMAFIDALGRVHEDIANSDPEGFNHLDQATNLDHYPTALDALRITEVSTYLAEKLKSQGWSQEFIRDQLWIFTLSSYGGPRPQRNTLGQDRRLSDPESREKDRKIPVEVGIKEILSASPYLIFSLGFSPEQLLSIQEIAAQKNGNPELAEEYLGTNVFNALFVSHQNVFELPNPLYRGLTNAAVREIVQRRQKELTAQTVADYFDREPLELLRLDSSSVGFAPMGPNNTQYNFTSDEVRQVILRKTEELTVEQIREVLSQDPLQALTFQYSPLDFGGPLLAPEDVQNYVKEVIGNITPEQVEDYLSSNPQKIFEMDYFLILERSYALLSPESQEALRSIVSRMEFIPKEESFPRARVRISPITPFVSPGFITPESTHKPTVIRVPDNIRGNQLLNYLNSQLRDLDAEYVAAEINPNTLAEYIKDTTKFRFGAGFTGTPSVRIYKNSSGQNILEVKGKIGTALGMGGGAEFTVEVANRPGGGVEVIHTDVQATGKVKEEIEKGQNKIATINESLVDQTNQRINREWEVEELEVGDGVIIFNGKKRA